MPIRRGKVIALVAGAVQIRCETQYSFAIAPARRAEGIAGRHEKRMTDSADTTRRPDATAPCARGPAYHLASCRERNPDHPAMVVATVPRNGRRTAHRASRRQSLGLR